MQPAVELRKRIDNQQLTLGVLVTDHLWPRLIEICHAAGLDYAIVDLEHGPHSDEAVAAACQIGRLIGFPVLVRTISTAYDVVRRALDLGPCGLMFPGVESPQQLDAAREAIYMPPRGRRRPGGPANHWMPSFHYEDWRTQVEDRLIVLPQIETRRGLECVAAIAAHPLTTAIAVGPYDLSADLGCCWHPETPQHAEAMRQIRAAGRAAGKNMWVIGDAAQLAAEGYTFLCGGEPSYMLQNALRQMVQAVK